MVKAPSNTDLGKKIDAATKELKKELNDVNVVLLRHDKSIGILEDKAKLDEYGRKIIEEYKAQEEKERRDKLTDTELTNRNAVWVKAAIALGLVIAILTAYAAGKGIK